MITQDDRTAAQLETHTWLVVGTDKFMSGWGEARGGTSVAAWACLPEDRKEVLEWVERRNDMKRVRESSENCYRCGGMKRDPVHGAATPAPEKCSRCKGRGRLPYRPGRAAHFHVYVVERDHPALESKRRMEALCTKS